MAKKEKEVVLRKSGNMLQVNPTSDRIFSILKPVLSFSSSIKLYGQELAVSKRQGRSGWNQETHTLMELDHKDRIITNYGFWNLIRDALRQNGYTVKFQDLSPSKPEAWKPRWENIKKYDLRENQPEFIKKVLTNRCGRIDCPPGFGKTFMIGIIASLLPKARIDVVTRRVAVLRDRIYPELVQMVGDVGIRGGGKNSKNKRVMCYTVGSMHHAKATDADILFGDECHELAADVASAQLVRWQNSRNFGLSASHDMRFDNKDLRMQGVFGPIVLSVDYSEAEGAKMVVPLDIKWSSVVLDYDPSSGIDDTVENKRRALWRNDARNQIIAEDARKYDDDTQVLITVETLDHAMNLKKLLPEYTMVYMENGLPLQRKNKAVKEGFITSSEPEMTIARRQKLTKDFESGKLKKVIATTVWNVGVSFNALQVLIRADGGGSSINDIQIPGRVSRTSKNKERGIVHDYLDQFSYKYKLRAKGRAQTYADNSWNQEFPREGLLSEYLK
jgi:superfamily II DNA or RNA helicase